MNGRVQSHSNVGTRFGAVGNRTYRIGAGQPRTYDGAYVSHNFQENLAGRTAYDLVSYFMIEGEFTIDWSKSLTRSFI